MDMLSSEPCAATSILHNVNYYLCRFIFMVVSNTKDHNIQSFSIF